MSPSVEIDAHPTHPPIPHPPIPPIPPLRPSPIPPAPPAPPAPVADHALDNEKGRAEKRSDVRNDQLQSPSPPAHSIERQALPQRGQSPPYTAIIQDPHSPDRPTHGRKSEEACPPESVTVGTVPGTFRDLALLERAGTAGRAVAPDRRPSVP
ncbi:hypothetical protein GCM10017589_02680 [Streptomyces poonensis]|nr:hypothetical protein GCM10017589_02680 [Streptomyces poonensis]